MKILPAVRQRIIDKGVPKTKGRDLDWFLASAEGDRRDLELLHPLGSGDVVVDVGCGYGRLAAAFAGTDVVYLGVDVHPKRIDYASDLFEPYMNVTFIHLDYRSDRYNPGGINDPEQFRIGVQAGKVSAVAAVSLFTHMPDEKHVRAYLREFYRLLATGGTLLTTWLTHGDPEVELKAARSVHKYPEALLCDCFVTQRASGNGTVADHVRVVSTRKP